MTPLPPPWCLQWSSDGELNPHDRRDLLSTLVQREAGLTRRMLAGALQSDPRPACGSTPIPHRHEHDFC